MVKWIACPFDFGPAALNAVEYASNIARITEAHLTLMHVEKLAIGDGAQLFSGAGITPNPDETKDVEKLEEYVKDIRNSFGIECNYKLMASMFHFTNSILEESQGYDLIVTGTNGMDNLLQFYLGTDSYRLARKSDIPVLIVPELCSYQPIRKILFASDYAEGDSMNINQLQKIARSMNPELEVIHISKKDSPLSEEMYRSFVSHTEDVLSSIDNLHFERTIDQDPLAAIESYVYKSGADLLAVKYKPHSILYRYFHKNLIKELALDQQIPLLVFHN